MKINGECMNFVFKINNNITIIIYKEENIPKII